jgi:hypothetical protein
MAALRPALVGLALILCACGTTASSERVGPADVGGVWEGQIIAPDSTIIVTLQLSGQLGTMDVRSRQFKDVPVRVVTAPDSTRFVAITQTPLPASFVGVRKGEDITGTFREGGKQYHFWLTRRPA